MREWLVESGEDAVPTSRQAGEVGVRGLAVSVDRGQFCVDVGDRVRPEFAPWVRLNAGKHCLGCVGRLPHAQQEADEGSLDDGTHGEPVNFCDPVTRPFVVLVLCHRQRDKHVRIEEERGHSSSRAAATSAEVMVRPMESTGSPERGSTESATGASS